MGTGDEGRDVDTSHDPVHHNSEDVFTMGDYFALAIFGFVISFPLHALLRYLPLISGRWPTSDIRFDLYSTEIYLCFAYPFVATVLVVLVGIIAGKRTKKANVFMLAFFVVAFYALSPFSGVIPLD